MQLHSSSRRLNLSLLVLMCIMTVFCENTKKWTFFTFSQEWPPFVCLTIKDCKIPRPVSGWTIHGLWPSYDGGYPTMCNNSWRFSDKAIQPLEKQLSIQWPNIHQKGARDIFWKREWEKHGTCATSVAATDNEFNYFNTSLALHAHFDIGSALKRHEIVPSYKRTYQVADVQNALKTFSPAADTIINCENIYVHALKEKRRLISEIYMCVTKELEPRSCTGMKHTCELKEKVLLLPFPSHT